MANVFDSILQSIGNTPLIKLSKICPTNNLYIKAEWYNPGRSVKDRAGYNIIKTAIDDGRLTKDKTVLDATSGNTGIAFAMIGAALGYKVKICIPDNATPARKRTLKSYGAELVLTDQRLSTDGAIVEAKKIYDATPDQYFYADQYSNDANWQAHYKTTGPEIYEQTGGKITHFVAGLGTSGTFMGTSRYLKEQNKEITTIEVQPDSPFHGLEGWKHMESALVPQFYDPNLADVKMTARTEDAYMWLKKLALNEGLLVGVSCGGVLDAALKVAEQNPDGLVVCVFPDNGDKYLDEKFWDE